MLPPKEVVALFVQTAHRFEGTPIQRLLNKQRLARRIANEHRHRFSPDDLIFASNLSRAALRLGASDDATKTGHIDRKFSHPVRQQTSGEPLAPTHQFETEFA
jgi:flagellar basal body rod protein FlgB